MRHALQLDIDNAPVEQALMAQIEADPELQAMISEMFFEQHFTDAAVRALDKTADPDVVFGSSQQTANYNLITRSGCRSINLSRDLGL